ncbi:MAG: flagellar protein FlgN [Myxococcales bacterium]|nr:flagellar protein FlgN [Myxococcales bacterium]
MQDKYQQLIGLLGDELRLFTEFRSLLDQEPEAIRTFNTEQLDALTNGKRLLYSRLQSLESRRRRIVGEIARHFGLDPEKATLADLAANAPQAHQEMLRRARDIFKQLAAEVAEKVQFNTKRVDRSLWLIENLRFLMTQGIEEPSTYEELGRKVRRQTRVTGEGGRV